MRLVDHWLAIGKHLLNYCWTDCSANYLLNYLISAIVTNGLLHFAYVDARSVDVVADSIFSAVVVAVAVLVVAVVAVLTAVDDADSVVVVVVGLVDSTERLVDLTVLGRSFLDRFVCLTVARRVSAVGRAVPDTVAFSKSLRSTWSLAF